MPNVAFRRIQVKKEATRGTAVAADTALLGALTLQAQEENYIPEDEERNTLALLHRRISIAQHSTLKFNGSAKFEEIPHFLNMCMKAQPTAATPTSSTGTKILAYKPSLVAANAQNSYTFEYGDDVQGYQCNHVLATQLQLAYDASAEVRLSADLFGHYPVKSNLTGLLYLKSNPSVEDMVSLKTEVYIDNTWAGLGTTKKDNLLAIASITIPSGLTMTQYADGTLDFTGVVENKRALDFELTLLHNSDGVAQYDNYIDDSHVYIRLKTSGSEIETGHNKELNVDISAIYTEPPEFFGDRDGENIIILRGRSFQVAPSTTEIATAAAASTPYTAAAHDYQVSVKIPTDSVPS